MNTYTDTFIIDSNSTLMPADFMTGHYDFTITIEGYRHFSFSWTNRDNDDICLEAIHGYYGLEMATSYSFQGLSDATFEKLLLSDENKSLKHFQEFCEEFSVYLHRLQIFFENDEDGLDDLFENWLEWAIEGDYIAEFIGQYAY